MNYLGFILLEINYYKNRCLILIQMLDWNISVLQGIFDQY